MKKVSGLFVAAALFILLMVTVSPSWSAANSQVNPLNISNGSMRNMTDRLSSVSGGKMTMSNHAKTGKVRFLSVSSGGNLSADMNFAASASIEERGRSFLDIYGSLFGLTDQSRELILMKQTKGENGHEFVRFQQVYQNIPILGGELIVQTDTLKQVISVNGEISPDIEVNVLPAIQATDAVQIALGMVAKHYSIDIFRLSASKPELWIYNPLIIGLDFDQNSLTWLIEVSSDGMGHIRELVLIDAQTGMVALNFNQVDFIKSRNIHDKANTPADDTLPGSLVRSEGGASTSIADVDNAYDYAGDTYDFYWANHGRDSIDGAGMALIVTVRHCPVDEDCPYTNAFWNGTQMVFGQGLTTDDIMAHELTHGVTDYTSNLFYYMQSGAINESLSDVWGEFVDLSNGADLPADRWLCGEDSSLGSLRSMMDPTLFNDPDRMSSSYYACGSSDNGGVHTNSGINNKAVYLMVDGGTFNGQTVTGIGMTKTAKIYYHVQSNMLSSGSDYADLYDYIIAATYSLVDTAGITTADALEVTKALNAVEMNQQPTSCPSTEASVCVNKIPVDIFTDDIEDGGTHWTYMGATGVWEVANGASTWYKNYAASGLHNLYGYDSPTVKDSSMVLKTGIIIPPKAYLHFKHAYRFENGGWDGGVVEYTTTNGTTWVDAGSLITDNGYTGTISSCCSNPLGGRQAFTNYSNGYISSKLNLSTLAGKTVKFRFRIGSDSSYDWYGWYIDDVRIYTCEKGFCSDFEEDFSDGTANNWTTDGSGKWSVLSGAYRMTDTTTINPVTRYTYYDGNSSDFIYEAKVRKTSGSLNASMGLIFRSLDGSENNAYVFHISGDGYYTYYKNVDGIEHWLPANWIANAAILTGYNQWNSLKVVAKGSEFFLYCNDVLLTSFTDDSFAYGKPGLKTYVAGTFADVVEFDDVVLTCGNRAMPWMFLLLD